MYIGWGGNVTSTGRLTVAGGSIVVGSLNMASGTNSHASVQVTSGYLHAGTITLGGAETSSRFDIGGTGLIFVNGDLTGLGLPGNVIFSLDGGGTSIQESFDGSLTKFEVIPEPATFGLLALMGGGMLFARRNFRN